MSDTVDQEITAIKSVLEALTPLSEKARASVLDYVVKRLDMSMPAARQTNAERQLGAGAPAAPDSGASRTPVHIKQLKDQKKPRSANEMAALIAYYLYSVAPDAERKKTVNQKDMETYFKIAGFPLPNQIRVTLPNAKAAGYFDAIGDGEYKLNAVGYNLVVHSMPRGAAAEKKTASSQRRRIGRTAKKTSPRKPRT